MPGVVRAIRYPTRTYCPTYGPYTQKEDPCSPQLSEKWGCEFCGEIYAEVLAIGRHYTFLRGCCHNCKGLSFTVPGSVWKSWDLEYLTSLPLAVLLYEFELHLKHYLGET